MDVLDKLGQLERQAQKNGDSKKAAMWKKKADTYGRNQIAAGAEIAGEQEQAADGYQKMTTETEAGLLTALAAAAGEYVGGGGETPQVVKGTGETNSTPSGMSTEALNAKYPTGRKVIEEEEPAAEESSVRKSAAGISVNRAEEARPAAGEPAAPVLAPEEPPAKPEPPVTDEHGLEGSGKPETCPPANPDDANADEIRQLETNRRSVEEQLKNTTDPKQIRMLEKWKKQIDARLNQLKPSKFNQLGASPAGAAA